MTKGTFEVVSRLSIISYESLICIKHAWRPKNHYNHMTTLYCSCEIMVEKWPFAAIFDSHLEKWWFLELLRLSIFLKWIPHVQKHIFRSTNNDNVTIISKDMTNNPWFYVNFFEVITKNSFPQPFLVAIWTMVTPGTVELVGTIFNGFVMSISTCIKTQKSWYYDNY